MSKHRFPGSWTARAVSLATASVASLSLLPAVAADTYVRATVDEDGQLRIVTASGRIIEPTKDEDQLEFGAPQISPDGRAVGWLAEYANCCTSYPIPLKLMIYVDGNRREFTGAGLPIWRWRFRAGGSQFAFQQETVHGGLGVHYELRDVATGGLLADYEPTVGPDNRPVPSRIVPEWVSELDTSRQ
jgi:hypothetical protein